MSLASSSISSASLVAGRAEPPHDDLEDDVGKAATIAARSSGE
ncbi:hypothetical protein X731_09245 [Mesorhizobium sp. L2C054A000]|nr:hypothetical protein X731_09245 [Mesorhizobium sp. L2C054A000]